MTIKKTLYKRVYRDILILTLGLIGGAAMPELVQAVSSIANVLFGMGLIAFVVLFYQNPNDDLLRKGLIISLAGTIALMAGNALPDPASSALWAQVAAVSFTGAVSTLIWLTTRMRLQAYQWAGHSID